MCNFEISKKFSDTIPKAQAIGQKTGKSDFMATMLLGCFDLSQNESNVDYQRDWEVFMPFQLPGKGFIENSVIFSLNAWHIAVLLSKV